MNEEPKEKATRVEPKRAYEPPKIETEPWLLQGAAVSCNGTTSGGRKDSVGAPFFCSSSRLLS